MLSAIVLTHNEEKNIKECLSSLSFCDEILVIDDNSTDNTVSLAKKEKAKVLSHALNYNFANQRNYGLAHAKGDWVLFIDADERVDQRLRKNIEEATKKEHINGFYIKRRDYMWGRPLFHGENGHREILRLAKKTSGKWVGKVHEVWHVSEPTQTLHHYLLHYPHQSVVEFLEEVNLYTTLRAKELLDKGVQSSWWQIIAYPKAKFIQNYIVRFGFLDGVRGLIVAVIMSFHSFMVRGKLWELQNKK